jgi:hypothetical protein
MQVKRLTAGRIQLHITARFFGKDEAMIGGHNNGLATQPCQLPDRSIAGPMALVLRIRFSWGGHPSAIAPVW